MAERVIRICDIPDCPTPEDNVRRCTVGIHGPARQPELCEGHQAPLRELLDLLPKPRARTKTKGIAGKVVPIESIPKVGK